MSNGRRPDPPRRRLDVELVRRKLVSSRSQAENYIKLGRVSVNRNIRQKAGQPIGPGDKIEITGDQYVSRAALKLASVAGKLDLDFKDKIVLDVGSSTGGFTDYSLQHGARHVIAVDVGTDQLHPKLRADRRVEPHEKTDIRHFKPAVRPDLIVIDVSFISLKQILPAVIKLAGPATLIVAMVKPQFETGNRHKHRGVIKNDTIRRAILKDFEFWLKRRLVIIDKADAEITGSKGNLERFYKLAVAKR